MSALGTIAIDVREAKGSTACRRLRRAGLVPANVYGHGEDPVMGSLPAETALAIANAGAKVVDLTVSGAAAKALVRELQWDTFSTEIIHVDFQRVDANERVHVQVPVHLRGTAPGVVAGGILEQPVHVLDIECLAVAIPDQIVIRVGSLKIGDALHVNELTEVPDGVTITAPGETMIVHVVAPRGAEEEETPAAEGESATES